MGLRDRLNMVWLAATNFKALATLVPTWLQGTPQWTTPSMHTLVKKGYSANELIWRCIQERSNSASAPRMLVKSKSTGEHLKDHPLQKLIQSPNHTMSESDLWKVSLIYADLTGKAYWEQIRSRAGNTVEMWPLRPDRIKPIPDRNKLVSGYEYQVPGLEPVVIPAENMVEYKVFDPLSLYDGIAPAMVAAKALDVDISMGDYLKMFFDAGGIPPGLIKTKKKLIESDVRDIRTRWTERYGGFENWLAPAVLDMDAEYQKTGFSFQEMGFDILDARSEVRVSMVFMIPPVLIGARVGLDRATFANYREARTAFLEDTMLPTFGYLRDTFQREIADREWEDVELEWDFTNVPVLFQKRLDQMEQHRANYLSGGLILNEYRRFMGLADLPGNAGAVRVQSLAFQIIPEAEQGQLVPLKNPVGVGDTKKLDRPNGDRKDALPSEGERDEVISTEHAKVEEFLDKQKDRIKDAATPK